MKSILPYFSALASTSAGYAEGMFQTNLSLYSPRFPKSKGTSHNNRKKKQNRLHVSRKAKRRHMRA